MCRRRPPEYKPMESQLHSQVLVQQPSNELKEDTKPEGQDLIKDEDKEDLEHVQFGSEKQQSIAQSQQQGAGSLLIPINTGGTGGNYNVPS